MKTITLEAVIPNLAEVTAFVDAELEAADCPIKAQMQIDVALDELFSNVARYAYSPGTGEITVCCGFDAQTRVFVLSLRDRGVPYNPLEAAEPDTTLPAEERAIGGLGIFLVRKTMDSMDYRREGGENVVTITKKI